MSSIWKKKKKMSVMKWRKLMKKKKKKSISNSNEEEMKYENVWRKWNNKWNENEVICVKYEEERRK